MDAKLFTQHHDAVAGFRHPGTHTAAHARRATANVIEAATGGAGSVTQAGLKSCGFALEIDAKVPKQAEPLGSPFYILDFVPLCSLCVYAAVRYNLRCFLMFGGSGSRMKPFSLPCASRLCHCVS